MASVYVDRRHGINLPGMEGNYWDFHPGCHGITEYGDFRGYSGLVSGMKNKIYEMGRDPVVDYNTDWKY